MAVGDVVAEILEVPAGGSVDIKPSTTGEEWVIHNIAHTGPCQLVVTDGTNEVLVDEHTAADAWLGYFFHVTTSYWIRIKNTDTENSILVSYDGVVTKSP